MVTVFLLFQCFGVLLIQSNRVPVYTGSWVHELKYHKSRVHGFKAAMAPIYNAPGSREVKIIGSWVQRFKGLHCTGVQCKLVSCKSQHRTSQGCNVRKVNCSFVYSAYILKPVLSGRNL